MPSSTVENYLKAILVYSEQTEGETTVTALAEALSVTPGSVTTMTKGLAAKGLLEHPHHKGVRLTASGRSVALKVLRKHRLVEAFLVQILKMDWTEVHEEAEALEHAISDRVLVQIDVLLGHPSTDPHGDPIPNPNGKLVESGDKTTLATCTLQKPLRVVRISDQTPEFLEFIQKSGLKPGTKLRVSKRDKAGGVVHCALKADRATVIGLMEASKVEVQVIA